MSSEVSVKSRAQSLVVPLWLQGLFSLHHFICALQPREISAVLQFLTGVLLISPVV